jgi:hypothetical protein
MNRLPYLRLLMAVRSDCIGRLSALANLGEAMSRCLYVLRPMSAERLRETVVGPVQARGVRFEDEALIDSLVDTTAHSSGGLPLLQVVLSELWEAKDGSLITAVMLESLGGMAGVLSRYADHVIGSMLAERRILARRILCSMVGPQGTPLHSSEAELLAIDKDIPPVLEALVRSRLVFVRSSADGPSYELAHTALTRSWQTLQRWLLEPDSIRLKPVTGANEPTGRSPKGSAKAARRRVLWYAVPLLGLGILLFGYAGTETRATLSRRQAIAAHEKQGHLELIVARTLRQEQSELRAQAFKAFAEQQDEEAEQLLLRAHSSSTAAERAYSRASHQIESALSVDGNRADMRNLLADILYERALAAESDHQEVLLEDLLQRLALYDASGQRLQNWSRPGRVTITTLPSQASVQAQRFKPDAQKHWIVTATLNLGNTPLPQVELEPGAYVFVISIPGFVSLRQPVVVGRAAEITQSLTLAKLIDNN